MPAHTLEELEEEMAEDDEDTEITNYDVGEEALDRLAIAMGGKTMVPVLFERIQVLIKSADWKHRHAALMAISQSGEGCEKQMAQNLSQILNMIVTHFQDAHPRVRWAAGNCIVLKPAEQTPASILVLMELIADLLPPALSARSEGRAVGSRATAVPGVGRAPNGAL